MADNLREQADPRLRQSAALIERSGRNLLRLINQILDLSRLEAGEMPLTLVRTDLVRFMRFIGESFDFTARAKGVRLIIHAEEDRGEADINPDKLQDIVANLLGNALKFTPAGGQVTCDVAIQTRWQPLTPAGYYEALTPTTHLNDLWIQITVSDTGPGIDPPSLTRLFDRFYQAGPRQSESNAADSASGGTGIGLSLVRELVSLMQGGLAVHNRPGLEGGPGAEFVVYLPITRQAPLADDVRPIPVLPTPDPAVTTDRWMDMGEIGDWVEAGRGENPDRLMLLLVEDNDDVATYIEFCLRDAYQITRAENGQIGIDQVIAIIPDLIVSDVMMPAKDGFDLCDTLKNNDAPATFLLYYSQPGPP